MGCRRERLVGRTVEGSRRPSGHIPQGKASQSESSGSGNEVHLRNAHEHVQNYPLNPPSLSLVEPTLLGPDHVYQMNKQINDHARKSLGREMLFDVNLVKMNHNLPSLMPPPLR